MREALFESRGERSLPRWDVEPFVADEDVVEAVGVEFAESQVLGDAQPFVDAAQRPPGSKPPM